MKLFLITLLLPVLAICSSCGGGLKPAQKNVKQLQDVQQFIEKTKAEKDGERRQDEVFIRLGKFKDQEQFRKYVEMISNDDYTGNYEISEVK
jgi:hypothetical protein